MIMWIYKSYELEMISYKMSLTLTGPKTDYITKHDCIHQNAPRANT